MNVLHMTLATALVAAMATTFGCADKQAAEYPTETETTAAATPMSGAPMSSEVARLERERNDANAALAEERVARATEEATQRAHDELEERALAAMEKADVQIQALRTKAARSSAKERKAIDKAITEAQQHKTQLYGDLRRLQGELTEPWDDFNARVESTISDLDRATSMESAESQTGAQPEKKTKTPTEEKKMKEEKKMQ